MSKFHGDIMSMMATTSYMMVLIKAETSDKQVPGYVFLFSGQKQKYIWFHARIRVRFFFQWCSKAIWLTMFYITSQLSRTFYCSFSLWKRSPPSCNFTFAFDFLYLRMKKYCDYSLVERLEKFSAYMFSFLNLHVLMMGT